MGTDLNYPAYVNAKDMDEAFAYIAESLIAKNAQFLFGAGMSKSSEVPCGKDLLKDLLDNYSADIGINTDLPVCIEEIASEFPFEVIVEAIENNLSNNHRNLTNFLNDKLLDIKFKPSQAHKDFVTVCWWGGIQRLNQIFTANYDMLIEKVFGESRTISITDENSADIDKAKDACLFPIIHLHGLLNKKYMITETDVYSNDFRVLNSEFRTALNNAKAFVFVGYSMNDPDFRDIYQRHRQHILDRSIRHRVTYVVSPGKEYSYPLGKEVWKARGITWIPMDAEHFFAKLKHVMEWHSDMVAIDRVSRKLRISDEEELIEKVKRIANELRCSEKEALYFLADYGTIKVGEE